MGKRIAKGTGKVNRRSLLGLLALAVSVLAVGGVIARYVYGETGEAFVSTRPFYFASDLLRPVEEDTEYSLSPGSGSVTFAVRNFADDLRITEDDIRYYVTTDGGGLRMAGNDEDEPSSTLSGTLPGTPPDSEETSNDVIELSKLKDGESYTVTVTTNTGSGDAGYQTTLQATFTVRTADKVYKHLQSYGEYVILTVWAENVTGELSVDIPEKLIPDNTDPIMEAALTGGAFTDAVSFAAAPYASHTYRFFYPLGVEKPSVTAEDFAISLGAVEAVAASLP